MAQAVVSALPYIISAAGAGVSAASSAGAFGRPGGGASGEGGMVPFQRIPLTPETRASQRYALRAMAAASQYRAPTLLEYARGGSVSTGPHIPGPTPLEAIQMGLVTSKGQPIDDYDIAVGGPLTPEQLAAAGAERRRRRRGTRGRPARRLSKTERRLERLERREVVLEQKDKPKKLKKVRRKIGRTEARRENILARYGLL